MARGCLFCGRPGQNIVEHAHIAWARWQSNKPQHPGCCLPAPQVEARLPVQSLRTLRQVYSPGTLLDAVMVVSWRQASWRQPKTRSCYAALAVAAHE